MVKSGPAHLTVNDRLYYRLIGSRRQTFDIDLVTEGPWGLGDFEVISPSCLSFKALYHTLGGVILCAMDGYDTSYGCLVASVVFSCPSWSYFSHPLPAMRPLLALNRRNLPYAPKSSSSSISVDENVLIQRAQNLKWGFTILRRGL